MNIIQSAAIAEVRTLSFQVEDADAPELPIGGKR